MTKFSLFICCCVLLISSLSLAADPVAAPPKVNLQALSTDEVEIYQHGEISDGSRIGGGLAGTFVGLGIGHAVYGQYGAKGWIFTVGELGSIGVMAAGATAGISSCFSDSNRCSNGMGAYVFGAIAYLGFRVWEIIDVWTLPGSYNDHYRAIKAKAENTAGENASPRFAVLPMLMPTNTAHSAYGLQFSYRF